MVKPMLAGAVNRVAGFPPKVKTEKKVETVVTLSF
jgi:hypothetical protein